MLLKNDCHVGRRIEEFDNLQYEDLVVSIAVDLIRRDSVVIDCGSMYGSTISAFQDKLGYEGMIIGIEPGRIAFECLKNNLVSSHTRTILLNNALSDVCKTWLRHKITDDRGSSLVTDWDHTGDNIISMTIDGITKYMCLHRLDLIKIKCQGWEYKILQGAKNTIQLYQPILIIEINHTQLALHKNTFKDIKDLLLNEGYSLQIIEENLKEESDQFNILCKPRPFELAMKAMIQAQCLTSFSDSA